MQRDNFTLGKKDLLILLDFCTSSSGQLGIDQTESVDPDAGCG